MIDNLEEEDREDWLVTYADAITLLMAFFILLVSFSKVDIAIYEQVAAGIKNEIGNRDVESPLKALERTAQDIVNEMQASQVVSIGTDDKGLVIDIEGSALFKPASAEIRAEAVLFLTKLAETLEKPKFNGYTIEIEGHTDDIPVETSQFPSNWELSTARASTVVRFLEGQDFDSRRLKASGYAHTRPKLPNKDEAGNPIPENQQKNRRIAARISPMSLKERQELLSSAARAALEAEEASARAQAAAQAAAEAALEVAKKAGAEVENGTVPPTAAPVSPNEAEQRALGTQPESTPSPFDRVSGWVDSIIEFVTGGLLK